jgi:two-component system LytT family sensor kinase
MKLSWFKNKWVNLFLHGAFWVLFFLLPFLLQPSFRDDNPVRRRIPDQEDFLLFNLMKCFFWMAIFYLNAYVLVPQLIYRRKYLYYILSLILVLAVLSLFEIIYFQLGGRRGPGFHLRGFLLFNFSPFLFIIAGSTAFRMFSDKRKEEQKRKEKEAENLKSELSFLRSQISPHFMFNVLNNIVALARKKSDLVEPSLIKLSSLMRYFLYENEKEKVSLQKEIEYLQSYIDLQQQRFGSNVAVNVFISETDSNYEIEPMLLIPFVENAFKHGVVRDGSINISLEVRSEILHFSVTNRYHEKPEEAKDETPGIGLANVMRRLNLLYENNHMLLITKRGGFFKVSLELKLH